MVVLLQHALLGASVLALVAAGSQAAAALGGRGLERVIGALALAASAAAIQALGLGLVGLGSSPVALAVAAGATWTLAATLLPAPSQPLASELADGWRGLPLAGRVVVGAVAGASVAAIVWFLAHPAVGGDGLRYHLPIIVSWVTEGSPGTLTPVAVEAPYEAYPLVNELLLAWGVGIAGSFVAVSLWTPGTMALLALAAWAGMRRLGIDRLAAGFALAALATTPILVSQLNTIHTDLPALAWLICCASLCAAAMRNPGMLVPALCAAGLGVGTKTTVLPLAAACLGLAIYLQRARLRGLIPVLAPAVAVAAVIGGLWYFRNLVRHGSPLWPFATTPWGEELPPIFDRIDGRLILDPESARGRLGGYLRNLGGALALLAGGLVAPFLSRSRAALAVAAAVGLSILIWASAPFTAFPAVPYFDGLQAGSVRYLAPAIAAGALALALAASTAERLARMVALGLLVVAVVGSLGRDISFGFPLVPSALTLFAGATAGAAVVWLATAVRVPAAPGRRGVALVCAASAVGIGALLTPAVSGYVERSTAIEAFNGPGIAWLAREPTYGEGGQPVAMQNTLHGTVAGDELEHPLVLVPTRPDCGDLRRRADVGWVVIWTHRPAAVAGFEDIAADVDAGISAALACLDDRSPAFRDRAMAIYAPIEP